MGHRVTPAGLGVGGEGVGRAWRGMGGVANSRGRAVSQWRLLYVPTGHVVFLLTCVSPGISPLLFPADSSHDDVLTFLEPLRGTAEMPQMVDMCVTSLYSLLFVSSDVTQTLFKNIFY